MGAVGLAVDPDNNTALLLCGGYTEDNQEDPPRAEYLNTCQEYTGNKWGQAEGRINTKETVHPQSS